MKCIVLDEPLTWALVCLISGTVAEQVGPDVFGVYLTALAIAAVAVAFLLFPNLRPRQSASWRRPQ
jgi:hypothetical protein